MKSSKVDKYGWAEIVKREGTTREVALDRLNVDSRYQRQVILDKARRIAAAWDSGALGYLVVSQRGDGSLWVIDGGHRLAAGKLRSEIKSLPCKVLFGLTVADEAHLFRILNETRIAVCVYDRYRAGLLEGDAAILACEAMLQRLGLRATGNNGRGPDLVRFVGRLLTDHRRDADSCAAALVIQRAMIGPDQSLHDRVHRGVWHLITTGEIMPSALEAEGPRVQVAGGLRVLLGAIAARQALTQNYGAVDRVCAAAVLEVVNKGKHRRLQAKGINA
jgi:hypothetical protein